MSESVRFFCFLSDFFNIDGKDNEPGYNRYWFIHDSSVVYIPPVVDGVIDFEKITYAPGKDTWYVGGAIFESIELGEKEQKTANGSLYPINIAAKTAGIQPNVLTLFHRKRNGRFILIVADNNGNYFLCGEPNNGLIFNYSREAASFSFSYKGNYTIPCYFLANYLGSDPTPDPGGGVGGGLVTIKRVDGTIITTGTAPLEYTVANTNAVLKNSGGLTLSTTAIKAAGAAQEIPAPDAVINLRDTAGALLDTINAKSGETTNVPAPNGTVTLKNTDDFEIGVTTVKSGESKEAPVPDTHVVSKNSLGEIIDDVYVASGTEAEINIGDVTVNVRDSADAILTTTLVPAEKVANIPVEDAQVNLNSAAWLDVKASSIGNIDLVDQDDTPITPKLANSTTLKVQVFESESYIVRRAARYANLIITGNSNSILR